MNDKIRTYRDLKVWQVSEELFDMICDDYRSFPKNRIAWVIGDQVIRSISSIGANIAEGFARQTKQEFIQFLNIARGSVSESEVWIERARKQKLISEDRAKIYKEKLFLTTKMLNAFMRSLRISKTVLTY